jgi:RNA polymerase sigma factor (sigma-70 family)
VQPDTSHGLLEVYLDRRLALTRFFTLRTGSDALAEDIVQDIFLKLQAMAPESVAAVQSPAAYLYRLGSNIMLDRARGKRRSDRRDDDWVKSGGVYGLGDAIADEPSAEDAAWARLKLGRVIAAIGSLPDNARTAFRLHKLEGLTHAETAQAMGVSRSAVEKYVSATLKHLLREVGWP